MDTREAKPEGLRERKRREIASRHLLLDVVPHPDTLSEWINDVSLTPVLRSFLAVTAAPFRRREIGAIIDSSKLSQMRSVHSRWVEYTLDSRVARVRRSDPSGERAAERRRTRPPFTAYAAGADRLSLVD
jgi:hypothetical protein